MIAKVQKILGFEGERREVVGRELRLQLQNEKADIFCETREKGKTNKYLFTHKRKTELKQPYVSMDKQQYLAF